MFTVTEEQPSREHVRWRPANVIAGVLLISFCACGTAILVPVWKAAKLASPYAISLSNTKQQSLAAIMYAADFDDYLPLGTIWHTGKDQLCFPAPAGCFSTWAWSIQPYMKSSGLFNDPTVHRDRASWVVRKQEDDEEEIQDRWNTLTPDYGYNYNFLSPCVEEKGVRMLRAVSQNEGADRGNTVMMASKWTTEDDKSPYYWGTGFPGGMMMSAGVESLKSSSIHPKGWGIGGFFDHSDYRLGLSIPETEGRYAGGLAARAVGKVVVGFVDGHSKKLSFSELAAGTNWKPGVRAQDVVVTDSKSYYWNLSK